MTWVHWVLLDLPADSRGLVENATDGKLPAGARVGVNDWQRATWGGPCPPIGRHRYFFKLYALDRTLGLDRPTKTDVENAMKGHIVGEAKIIGTYQKKK
jgi:Raf kinase inhibitor-like YbhB/YbcL family protein